MHKMQSPIFQVSCSICYLTIIKESKFFQKKKYHECHGQLKHIQVLITLPDNTYIIMKYEINAYINLILSFKIEKERQRENEIKTIK